MMRFAAISSSRGDVWIRLSDSIEPFELRHVERGGRALARDVGDEHAEAVVVERKKS